MKEKFINQKDQMGEEQDFKEKARVFHEYFPDGEMENIKFDDIPEVAKIWFEKKSEQFVDTKNYKQNDFEKCAVINSGGTKIFLAKQTKTYDTCGDTEQLIYLVDIDKNGEEFGNAEIRNNISSKSKYFVNKPFIGWIATRGKPRSGVSIMQRLKLMNAVTQSEYGLPLYSDTVVSPSFEKFLNRMSKRGLVKKFKEGQHDRYMFIDKNKK